MLDNAEFGNKDTFRSGLNFRLFEIKIKGNNK
jgi:hypothetical protein